MMFASENGHEGTVRLLIEAGAAVESKANDGWTALALAIRSGRLDVARVILETGAELPPSKVDGQFLRPDKEMKKLLAFHRGERRALAAVEGRPGRKEAEAAAAAAMDSLLAEEEAEKSSEEARQAKAKRKKQRQKIKRAEAVPGPAQTGGARSRPAPSGADLPSKCSGSHGAAATGAGVEEGQSAAAEVGALRIAEGGVSAGAV